MPPKKGRKRSAPEGGSSGRPKVRKVGAQPNNWRHLQHTKRPHEAVEKDPQRSTAFLSLPISCLESHVTERKWSLLSSRATKYLQGSIRQEVKPNPRSRQQKVSGADIEKNAAFISLKYGKAAWERGVVPLARSWKARQVAGTLSNSGLELKPQTEENEESAETLDFPTPALSASNKSCYTSEVSRLVGATTNLRTTDRLGFNIGLSPVAPEYSPLTPGFPQYLLPPTPAHSDFQGSFSESETRKLDPYDMSGKPSMDVGGVDESIKDVIQNLFVMQQHVASFRPEHQDGLNRKVEDVAVSLQKLDGLVADTNNPIHNIKVAPDIIDYVDDGRNPDIYTRDFVELVQRGNAVLNGKQKAFRNFSKIFAKALKENFDGTQEEVDMIMGNAGMEDKNGRFVEKQQNGNST